MTQMILDHTEEDARIVIKAAFEETEGIKKYSEGGRQIVGKTGWRLTSHGETVSVDISENPDKPSQTPIEITAEKEVQVNMTANPQKFKRRLIKNIENLRKYNVDEILDTLGDRKDTSGTKEVQTSSELPGGVGLKIAAIAIIFTVLMWFMMMMAMPY